MTEVGEINLKLENLEKPLLTVLIPTFNGQETIGRALESVIQQVEENQLESTISIIISDNSSTDATRNIAAEFAKSRSWIQVHQTPSNVGVDGNIEFGMKYIRTRFVKILCDDDLFQKGYLTHLLRVLIENPNAGLIVSSMVPLHLTNAAVEKIPSTPIWKSFGNAKFLRITDGAYGQLSTLCFQTDSWLNAKNSPILEGFTNNGMEFLARVYHLAIFEFCIWDDSKLLLNDQGPKRWNNSYFDVFKVNSSHASFVFIMQSLNKDSFPNPRSWNNVLNRASRLFQFQLIIDLLSLRRSEKRVNKEGILKVVPLPVRSKFLIRLFLNIVDHLPSSLCILIVRLNYLVALTRHKFN